MSILSTLTARAFASKPARKAARRPAHRAAVLVMAAVLLGPLPAAAASDAAGDAAKGESEFRKCKSCHMIAADDGSVIVAGGKTGPNLFGVVGRRVASTGYDYGPSLRAAGETGMVWDQAAIAAYVTDPAAWLREQTGDPAARSKMPFKLTRNQADVAAYLATLGPAPAPAP